MFIHTVITIITLMVMSVLLALCHDLRLLLAHRHMCVIGAGQGFPAVVCAAVAVCRQRASCQEFSISDVDASLQYVCASTLVSRGLHAAPLAAGWRTTSSTKILSICRTH